MCEWVEIVVLKKYIISYRYICITSRNTLSLIGD